MPTITLDDARTAVRQRSGREGSDYPSDAILNGILNGRAAQLHAWIVVRYEDDFTMPESTVVSAGNTISLLALTKPVLKIRGVDRREGSEWCALQRSQFKDRNRRASGVSSYLQGRVVRYRDVGNLMYLTPEDAATGTYRIWYVPQFVPLTQDSDEFTFPEHSFEFVILMAIADVLALEESENVHFVNEAEKVKAELVTLLSNRDAGAPERMVRTRHYDVDDEDECY